MLTTYFDMQKLTIKRVFILLLAWLVLYQLWIFLHICWWTHFNPQSTAFMDERLATMQEKNPAAELQYQWVPYKKISKQLKRAVIAAEDTGFIHHQGFDWQGIKLAYKKNIKKRKIVAGGSTISQQLAKNLFLSSKRTPWRKVQEAVITLMLEAVMSKKRILEIYLNVIEWGDGVFGVQAAANHYFKTSATNISTQQAAKLAAMVPNPNFYDKHRSTRFLNRKTATIQARMRLVEMP